MSGQRETKPANTKGFTCYPKLKALCMVIIGMKLLLIFAIWMMLNRSGKTSGSDNNMQLTSMSAQTSEIKSTLTTDGNVKLNRVKRSPLPELVKTFESSCMLKNARSKMCLELLEEIRSFKDELVDVINKKYEDRVKTIENNEMSNVRNDDDDSKSDVDDSDENIKTMEKEMAAIIKNQKHEDSTIVQQTTTMNTVTKLEILPNAFVINNGFTVPTIIPKENQVLFTTEIPITTTGFINIIPNTDNAMNVDENAKNILSSDNGVHFDFESLDQKVLENKESFRYVNTNENNNAAFQNNNENVNMLTINNNFGVPNDNVIGIESKILNQSNDLKLNSVTTIESIPKDISTLEDTRSENNKINSAGFSAYDTIKSIVSDRWNTWKSDSERKTSDNGHEIVLKNGEKPISPLAEEFVISKANSFNIHDHDSDSLVNDKNVINGNKGTSQGNQEVENRKSLHKNENYQNADNVQFEMKNDKPSMQTVFIPDQYSNYMRNDELKSASSEEYLIHDNGNNGNEKHEYSYRSNEKVDEIDTGSNLNILRKENSYNFKDEYKPISAIRRGDVLDAELEETDKVAESVDNTKNNGNIENTFSLNEGNIPKPLNNDLNVNKKSMQQHKSDDENLKILSKHNGYDFDDDKSLIMRSNENDADSNQGLRQVTSSDSQLLFVTETSSKTFVHKIEDPKNFNINLDDMDDNTTRSLLLKAEKNLIPVGDLVMTSDVVERPAMDFVDKNQFLSSLISQKTNTVLPLTQNVINPLKGLDLKMTEDFHNRQNGFDSIIHQRTEQFLPPDAEFNNGAITSEKTKTKIIQSPRPSSPRNVICWDISSGSPFPTKSLVPGALIMNPPAMISQDNEMSFGRQVGPWMYPIIPQMVPAYGYNGQIPPPPPSGLPAYSVPGKPSFIVPTGSQMPPQNLPYACTFMSEEHSLKTPTNQFRASTHDDDEKNDFDDHLSVHYKDVKSLLNKVYGNHSKVEGREANCEEGQNSCSDGTCYASSMMCDGIVHCSDASDETHCPCRSRIDQTRLCDGFFDCPLGEDELGCENCDPMSFSCGEKSHNREGTSCFTVFQRCDGNYDCPNKIDEHECTMLHDRLEHHAAYSVSHSRGFLHKNHKGKWYPVCENPYEWAKDACAVEARENDDPPSIQLVQKPDTFNGLFVQTAADGSLSFTRECQEGSALYVTCPPPKCGFTSQVVSQALRKFDYEEDNIFDRRKRFDVAMENKQRQVHLDPIVAIGEYIEDEFHHRVIEYNEVIDGHSGTHEDYVPLSFTNERSNCQQNPSLENGNQETHYPNQIDQHSNIAHEYGNHEVHYNDQMPQSNHELYYDNQLGQTPYYINENGNQDIHYSNQIQQGHSFMEEYGNQKPQSYNYIGEHENQETGYSNQIDNTPNYMQGYGYQEMHYGDNIQQYNGEHVNREINYNSQIQQDSNYMAEQSNREPHYDNLMLQAQNNYDVPNNNHYANQYRSQIGNGLYSNDQKYYSGDNIAEKSTNFEWVHPAPETINTNLEKPADNNNKYREETHDKTTRVPKESSLKQASESEDQFLFKTFDDFEIKQKKMAEDINNSNKKASNSARMKNEFSDDPVVRVVGGKLCEPAEWPSIIALYKDGSFICGAVLIEDMWVLTAAHCMDKYWSHYYEVQAGMLRRLSFSPQEQAIGVSHIMVHENYDKSTMQNDIALLKLNQRITTNRWVRPTCLPSESSAGHNWRWGPSPGTKCTAVGWGATYEKGPDPDHLRKVQVPILPHCKTIEDRVGMEICAGYQEGGKDACQGDSGGPLLCKNPHDPRQYYLAGLVSHGEGCARPGEPGVYTRVSNFLHWIRENMVEENYPSRRPKQECPGFSCIFGVQRCLPLKRKCDKMVDCLGAEDEINCPEESNVILRHSTSDDDIEENSFNSTQNISHLTKNTTHFGQNMSLSTNKTSHSTQNMSIPANIIDIFDHLVSGIKFNTNNSILTFDVDLGNSSTKVSKTLGNLTVSNKTVSSRHANKDIGDSKHSAKLYRSVFDHDETLEVNNRNLFVRNNDPTKTFSVDSTELPSNHIQNKSLDTTPKGNINQLGETTSIPVLENDSIITEKHFQTTETALLTNSETESHNGFANDKSSTLSSIADGTTIISPLPESKSDNQGLEMHVFIDPQSESAPTERDFPTLPSTELGIQKIFDTSTNDKSSTPSNLFAPSTNISPLLESKTDNLDLGSDISTELPLFGDSHSHVGKKELIDHSVPEHSFVNPSKIELNSNTLPAASTSMFSENQITPETTVFGNLETSTANSQENDNNAIFLENKSFTEDNSKNLFMTTPEITGDKSNEVITTISTSPSITQGTDNSKSLLGEEILHSTESNQLFPHESEKFLSLNGDNSVHGFSTEESKDGNKNNKIIFPLSSPSVVPVEKIGKPEPPLKFHCKMLHQKIFMGERCDGKIDCEDASDEWNCNCLERLQFNYPNLICDGYMDCADGTDESDCFKCPDDHTHCVISKQCVPNHKVCDSADDCILGEDERDCHTLSPSGDKVYLDMDSRPSLNYQGIYSIRVQGEWKPVCEQEWNHTTSERTADTLCRKLGLSGQEFFQPVFLRYNAEFEFIPASFKQKHPSVRENLLNPADLQLRGVKASSLSLTPQLNCKGLYIRCLRELNTLNLVHGFPLNGIDHSEKDILNNEVQDVTIWPWLGKIYVDGEYVCTGVLIDFSWVLVENFCASFLNLENSFVTCVLGSKRSLPNVEGPYEQIIRVDSMKILAYATINMLHLEKEAFYSRYVRPMPMPSFDMTKFDKNEDCFISTIDETGKDIHIFMKPVKRDCGLSNRCFELASDPVNCNPSIQRTYIESARWSGIVVCHRNGDWYPAASFNEPRGDCGFRDIIALRDLAYRKKDIQQTVKMFPVSLPVVGCDGARCKSGNCVPLEDTCNGVPDCLDGEDEKMSYCERKWNYCNNNPFSGKCACPVTEMICDHKCISKALFSNGVIDCAHGPDEPANPQCIHYLHMSHPRRVCDGIIHCKDKSDENPNFCKCHTNSSVPCRNTDVCVSKDALCDGVRDCPEGDDETACLALRSESKRGAGEVIEQRYGLWQTKCFHKKSFTRFELENICRTIGFTSGHSNLLGISDATQDLISQIVPHNFVDVSFKHAVISLRNSDKPLGLFEQINKNSTCYRLHIECEIL